MARRAAPLVLLAFLAASLPAALAHGLINLNVVVPADCPDGQTGCLETIDAQPPIHAGDEVAFFAYNDADANHTLHVIALADTTPPASASPTDALASTGPIPANSSRDAGDVPIPPDARALYVWCSKPGHEARGENLTLALEPASMDEESKSTPGPGGAALLGLAAAAFATVRRTRR